jgi:hypothetical protein
MQNIHSKIFTPAKVASEQEKVKAYLRGENIYPTTIELDLTQLCSRSCPGCPYGVARRPGLTLQLPFLDRLFGILGPHTPGIVLSGGESTIVPHYPETLKMAKQKGFREIATISNGANIHLPEVQDALMEYGTAIRVSMYEWQENESEHFINTLKKIEEFRNRIEKEGSKLTLGAAMLTRTEFNHRYVPVGTKVLNAGVHWLYFHPYCIDWDMQYPKQADQTGVIEALESFQSNAPENANIQIPYERYSPEPLRFDRLHGSFFLIQVGADGVNYAGPECKYDEDGALLDLHEYQKDDFLWHPQRIERLNAINSGNYRHIGTKHRPSIFSDYIQKIIDAKTEGNTEEYLGQANADQLYYPDII